MTTFDSSTASDFPAVHHSRLSEQEREELTLLGPPYPGEVLKETVIPKLGMSRKAFGKEVGLSYAALTRLLNGTKRVTPRLAGRLAEATGLSALYWLALQAHRDAWRLECAPSPVKVARRR